MSAADDSGLLDDFADSVGGLSQSAKALLSNPQGFILVSVATWIVKNVFIEPSLWVLNLIDWGYAALGNAITDAQLAVLGGLAPVGEKILGIPRSFHAGLEGAIANAGLAAPFVTTAAVVVEVVLLVAVSYAAARILIDIVPGLGGVIR